MTWITWSIIIHIYSDGSNRCLASVKKRREKRLSSNHSVLPWWKYKSKLLFMIFMNLQKLILLTGTSFFEIKGRKFLKIRTMAVNFYSNDDPAWLKAGDFGPSISNNKEKIDRKCVFLKIYRRENRYFEENPTFI